jgi:hypothetical protein
MFNEKYFYDLLHDQFIMLHSESKIISINVKSFMRLNLQNPQ